MVKRSLAGDRVWVFDVRDVSAATRLRREVVAFLRGHARDTDDDASELILGELLGNVVKHTPGYAEVALACCEGESKLYVTDRGPGFTATRATLPEDPLDENGRGMFLVHALSRKVSVNALPGGGTEVAVELPIRVSAVSA
ncbi:MAG: ATP-binding protein [Candidatus Eremiobacteraeota bacterium]|nr:ATP-binding protein [Candidatus Eremiobacteraeota bacterium]MBC5804151.1 ATP-binding protein [Candidatus Eremiobacteraeota bacterium]MBC5823031.1 ATP-binding protein [Candidatus Eremiobacteraeota bacterium]